MTESSELELLARTIEQLPHALFVKDRSYRYVLLNSALVDVGGYSRELIIGKTDFDFLPKELAESYRRQDIALFSGSVRGISIAEETFTHADGSRRVLMTRKIPLRASNGEITHVVGVLSDITRLKDVEDNLERRVAERTHALAVAQDDSMRKERLAVLGRLAGGVAHQIRNPLGAIKNAAYVLQRQVKTSDVNSDIAQAIEIIHDEVQRANQIITGLLDYARVRVPVQTPTDIHELIDRALAAQGALPASIDVKRRLAELPRVALDADQLEGALFNLLRNAIEAMPTGGTLTIEGELRDRDVVVRIIDTGDGIPDEIRSRLFEPLITTKPLGLGLGLVTARTLVEGQGGTLVLSDSHRQRGATFEVCLPNERRE